ncbi:MAG: hypothetical protein JWN34_3919 [Bryobacterales bacterium]|nr:hypothetical protein [Bryobacterales bacterium]
MALADLTDWFDDFDRPGFVWYIKRLSANDTLANNTHQAGPYIPKTFLFEVLPSLDSADIKNPDVWFDLYLDSHSDHKRVRAVYYNTRRRGEGTRDEARITNFGGRQSALLDPDSTGALTIFAFEVNGTETPSCHVWVCEHATEEDLIEERIGPVEPGQDMVWTPTVGRVGQGNSTTRTSCSLRDEEIPPAWLVRFPSGEEIIRMAVSLRSAAGLNPDARLVRRRSCEYELFQSVERAVYLPRIQAGFSSVEGFVGLAQSILQSRKSRSGNSLELHTRELFVEEGLRSMHEFQHKPIVENGKRPDFIFPSQAAYEDPAFPAAHLRMLAAKTTCKDRWRQVINEADRIQTKHLLTLQEGVSEGQFREMCEAGVQLVVPTGLHPSFPDAVRPHLMSLESFIADVRLSALTHESLLA